MSLSKRATSSDKNVVVSWDYEPKTFYFPVRRGNYQYTPDFFVSFVDGRVEWHEVKGWMDNNSKVKLKRFAKYFPDEVLVLIDREKYLAISSEFNHLEGWES